eukprot:CAMPEP_0206481354 /NCGR_PEP_ID=MMETSP0324_2-20121206/38087_1 /ASSEMBLY_ACC=CAM_ASM_000836 /TAXON_ID=2866 /ORGANISM="Crypthecodinium cohnii, Strain Seligo" /LENGTH=216 /DNA_ID=CAMNT_0053958811 /DNA_START=40 /DNA_END=687 /DNA_ORIENTATION=+
MTLTQTQAWHERRDKTPVYLFANLNTCKGALARMQCWLLAALEKSRSCKTAHPRDMNPGTGLIDLGRVQHSGSPDNQSQEKYGEPRLKKTRPERKISNRPGWEVSGPKQISSQLQPLALAMILRAMWPMAKTAARPELEGWNSGKRAGCSNRSSAPSGSKVKSVLLDDKLGNAPIIHMCGEGGGPRTLNYESRRRCGGALKPAQVHGPLSIYISQP